MEPLVLHYDVDGDSFASAGEASSSVKKVLRSIGVDSDIIRKTAICMYEGEINMVIHARGGTADVSFDGETIEITLKDVGPGIPDIESALREGWSTANERARDLGFGAGMGLPNMKANSDDISISTELGVGTTVIMKINLA